MNIIGINHALINFYTFRISIDRYSLTRFQAFPRLNIPKLYKALFGGVGQREKGQKMGTKKVKKVVDKETEIG